MRSVESASLAAASIVITLLGGISAASQFFAPARAVVMQRILQPEQRVAASSLAVASTTSTAVLAMVSGPALLPILGVLPALALNAVCFGISGALVHGLRGLDRVEVSVPTIGPENRSYVNDLRAGLATAWHIAELRLVIMTLLIYGLALGVNNSVLSVFALETLALSPAQYGVLSACFPVGNLVGAMLAPVFIDRTGPLLAMVRALLALGVSYIACLAPNFIAALVIMSVMGALLSVFTVTQGPVLLRFTPDGFMGRLTSITSPLLAATSVAGTGAMTAVFASASGAEVELHTITRSALIGAGCAVTMGALILLAPRRRPARRYRRMS